QVAGEHQQRVLVEHIVAVKTYQIRAAGLPDGEIANGWQPDPGGCEHTNAWVTLIQLHDLGGIVGRSVVYQQQFPVSVMLTKHALDGFGQETSVVTRHHIYGDHRCTGRDSQIHVVISPST